MADTQKISTCLWFDRNAEEAANFYVSVFKNSAIGQLSRYGEGAPMPKGTVLTVDFTLDGRPFMALNGGPRFKFNEAISLVVHCDTQAEIDDYWTRLTTDGGKPVQCGWLKDKFGLSWQIVPSQLPDLMHQNDPARADRVMGAILKMVKLDIAELERAAKG